MHPGQANTGHRRLRSCQRLKRTVDFQRVYDGRQAIHSSIVVVFFAPNGLPFSRLGVSVGRKHGNAVRRNRLKRVLREAFRMVQGELPAGHDYVLVPRRVPRPFGSTEVQAALSTLSRRIPLPREGQRVAAARAGRAEAADSGGRTGGASDQGHPPRRGISRGKSPKRPGGNP